MYSAGAIDIITRNEIINEAYRMAGGLIGDGDSASAPQVEQACIHLKILYKKIGNSGQELHARSILTRPIVAASEVVGSDTENYTCIRSHIPAQTWETGLTIVDGDYIVSSVDNRMYYIASGAGTTHATTEPVFPVGYGETIADNGIIWTCQGLAENANIVRDSIPITGGAYQRYWVLSGSSGAVYAYGTSYSCPGSFAAPADFRRIKQAHIMVDGQTYPISRVSDYSTYEGIGDKTVTSDLPTLITSDHNLNPRVYLYPIPEVGNVLVMEYYRKVQDIGNPTDNPDIPMEQAEELIAALAMKLALSSHDFEMYYALRDSYKASKKDSDKANAERRNGRVKPAYRRRRT